MPDEFDVEKASLDIGKELFSDPDPSLEGGSVDGSTTPPPAAPAGAEPANLAPLQPIPLPKAWKKEKEALWSKMDREAQEYLTARESDVLKGLESYSGSHKRWTSLVQPFEPVLQQYPDVDPVALMQNLMHNHLAIVRGTPEQKAQLAQKLLESYGISLPTAAAPGSIDPRIQQLEERLARSEALSHQFIQGQQRVALTESTKQV